MSYNPQIPPQDEKELMPFLSDELSRVATSYNDLQDGFWGVDHSLPLRVRPGMIKIFDGTDANPLLSGRQGVYYYNEAGNWVFLTDNQAVIDIITPLLEAFSDAILESVGDSFDYIIGEINNLVAYIDSAIGETPFTALTLGAGWTSISSVYRRYAKGVDLIFRATPGTITDGTALATLPAGFRPPVDCIVPLFINNTTNMTAVPFLNVATTGVIAVYGFPTGVTLCGASARIPIA